MSQVGLYLFLDDSQLARSTNHALNSIYILATSLTIIWHDKTRPPTFGEKSLKIAVYFAIMCFVTVPIAYVYIPNNYQYMSVLLLLQVLSVLMMMGGLQSLLMSDTINQHYELSIRDPLTGIYNRRYFFDKVKDCHMDFDKEPHSIIMCDIDFLNALMIIMVMILVIWLLSRLRPLSLDIPENWVLPPDLAGKNLRFYCTTMA
ncbi:diguanylate cyclase [Psychrosphaera sp. G1-22]|uniref:Diguanylate cyclase n=1 Tax=Psychrosphaera algicola TaxID=3023714 RepID=A0ABT5FGI2_9GAMM|nr:diguanylate cyclase [Psychrosphaera sp. G1-22]MDC2890319.1 diguanylate cyclase [Psychrosphaera sp. G1-22]